MLHGKCVMHALWTYDRYLGCMYSSLKLPLREPPINPLFLNIDFPRVAEAISLMFSLNQHPVVKCRHLQEFCMYFFLKITAQRINVFNDFPLLYSLWLFHLSLF